MKRKGEVYNEKATRLKVTMLAEFSVTQKAISTDLTNDKVLKADYIGDSVANMISDTIFTLFGLIVAWHLPIYMNIILMAMETIMQPQRPH